MTEQVSEQKTEDQIRSLVAHLDVAIILREVDPPRFVYVSPAFERIFGWPVEDMLGDPWFLRTHAHPDDRDVVTERMADLSSLPIPEIEWRIVRPDGEIRWVRAKRTLLATGPGQPQQIAGFIEDITERKATETELQRSRQWFEAIAETVPIGFAIRDADSMEYQYVSPAYEQIFGLPRQEFYRDPRTGYSLVHPEDVGKASESYAAAAAGEPWSYSARIVRPDGHIRHLRGHQLSTSGPDTGRWLASTVEDVTARRAQEEQLRSLIDANIVGVMIADDHRIVDANDRYLQIMGYTREDLTAGQIHWPDMTPPEWVEVSQDAMAQLTRHGSCAPFEKEYFTKEGRRVPLLVGSAILDRDPLTYSSLVLDLTEVKAVEVALRQAESEALRANEAKNAFLSRMSHELRTPLNAVIGFGQLLALDDLSGDQREGVDQIVKGGRHLLALINEVLDISRIESGGLALSLEPVQLAEVVDEALALVAHLGDARQVTIDDSCPPTCSAYVRGDRQRLRQVVLNLLANAIKYNRDHGSVTVHCSTGLGLALTKRLVEAMNGTIGAESVAGQGSTFWVEFDIAPAETSLDLPAGSGETEDVPEVTPDLTVLYIEDNQANVRLVQRILSLRKGVGAIVAMQASLGLDLARTHVPDLILLDLNLPDMPGTEALRRLRADPVTAGIPVVVVSADATSGQISRLLADGAADYLAKPFEIARLLELVDEHAIGRR